ncbi:poly(ADP-ribose)glycohydrolase PARG [Prosthecobacter fusiformis]|uniref:Poly(ADP-ribose)glycohydrolase PARG n=1 Tax=Prosthecobacter fusiformis TaxID=48464 RepID=A0A4R7S058_9BACT|nr:hypothetical protein [Prosthecobacter fusiformis]TDU70816.1 poly(ADP-ribose)glycohydrolase PARG [Prosthecobacter fusiformis]
MNSPLILQQLDFDAEHLIRVHPPVWKHPHKEAVYDRISREGSPVHGTLRYTRWMLSPLSGPLESSACNVRCRPGFYSYPQSDPGCWHVNFADPRLFAAYGSALMAQDEWQVLEHPVLGSLREALLHEGHPALTRENGASTPVTISNVPRVCAMDLTSTSSGASKSPWWGRLFRLSEKPGEGATNSGPLYGNAFGVANRERILQATTVLKPASSSNIIAMAAPTGSGRYSSRQILDILQTAFTGFSAAVKESERAGLMPQEVEIHTGWWGCGAFGGNRVLMAMLQVLAARMAQAGKVVFYVGEERNRFDFEEGMAFLEGLNGGAGREVSEIVRGIGGLGFSWGKSDGN